MAFSVHASSAVLSVPLSTLDMCSQLLLQVVISIDPTDQQEMDYWKQHNQEAYSMVEGAAEKLQDRCAVVAGPCIVMAFFSHDSKALYLKCMQSSASSDLQRRYLKVSGSHECATELHQRSLQAGSVRVPELYMPGADLRPGQGARAAAAEPHRASSGRPRRRQCTSEGSGHQQPDQVIGAGG